MQRQADLAWDGLRGTEEQLRLRNVKQLAEGHTALSEASGDRELQRQGKERLDTLQELQLKVTAG